MNKIRVAAASAFFQEKGLDANGIFRLLSNALHREYVFDATTSGVYGSHHHPIMDFSYIQLSQEITKEEIAKSIDNFKGDLEFAKERMEQFFKDYQQLKELDAGISSLGFWDFVFRRKHYVRELFRKRRKLLGMTISAPELLEVAYYKYVSEKLGEKEDFLRDLRAFLSKDTSK